jgi:hypothetical protein
MARMSEREIEEAYVSMLDECYPPVKIGYAEFNASRILKECDPVMYEQGLLDYEDSLGLDDDEDEGE